MAKERGGKWNSNVAGTRRNRKEFPNKGVIFHDNRKLKAQGHLLEAFIIYGKQKVQSPPPNPSPPPPPNKGEKKKRNTCKLLIVLNKANHSYRNRVHLKGFVVSPSFLDLCLNILQVINLSCALSVNLQNGKEKTLHVGQVSGIHVYNFEI